MVTTAEKKQLTKGQPSLYNRREKRATVPTKDAFGKIKLSCHFRILPVIMSYKFLKDSTYCRVKLENDTWAN